MVNTPTVSVSGLLHGKPEAIGLALEVLAGHTGLERTIRSPHIQKTGLALAGFHEYLREGRVLVFGESEVRYIESLPQAARLNALANTFMHDIPCVLITGGWAPPAELLAAAERYNMPLLRTPVPTPLAIAKITVLLEDRLAVREVIHGVLMDILGLGVFLVGESGIGKSECALDLVVRGHRLVADDTVEIRRRGDTVVLGTCPDLTRHHMEIRGLGVINVRDLFGIASTRPQKGIELVVQLERWDPSREYDRLGIEEATYDLLGLKIPLIRMPVAPGRSLAILVEVAARNQLLRARGVNAARDLVERLDRQLRDRARIEADDIERGEDV
jgi:HPr kinase/phosphorylase